MNTFIDRVNSIVQQNQQPTMSAPTEPAYPDAGIGALENVANGVPRQTMISNQPHMLAYINPQEEQALRDMGGSGLPGPGGIPAYWWHDDEGPSFTESLSNFGNSIRDTASNAYDAVSNTASNAYDAVSTAATNTFGDQGSVETFFDTYVADFDQDSTPDTTVYGTGPAEVITTGPITYTDSNGVEHSTQAAADAANVILAARANPLNTTSTKTKEQLIAEARAAGQTVYALNGNWEPVPDEVVETAGVLDKIIPDTGKNTALQNLGNLVSFLGDKTYVDGVEVEDERSFAEKIANLTLFDGAYYDPTGKLVEVSTGDDLTGGGTADGVFGENYVYGVADSAETGAEVDTTGMSDDEAITAQAKDDLLRDIPPSSLEYFASFFGNAVIPIFGNYLTGKMLDADIAGRRAIVDEQIAALEAGATPLYDKDGNYTGFDRSTMTGNVSAILDEYGAEGLLPGGLPEDVADDENDRFQTVFDVQSVSAENDPTGMSTEDGFITSDGTEYYINGDGTVQEVTDNKINYDASGGETVESVYDLEASAQTFSDGDPVVKSIYNRFRISGSTAGLPFYMSKWMDGVDFDERLEKVMVDGKVMYKNAEGDVISAEDLKNALMYDDDGNIIETEE